MNIPGDTVEIAKLVGQTLVKVEINEQDDEIIFTTFTGAKYRMYHNQDCCENVSIESVIGDWADLIDVPILVAEERTSTADESNVPDRIVHMAFVAKQNEGRAAFDYVAESYTWTFYTFRTIKGTVDLRWYGTSNGYYSESVSFEWA